MEYILIIIYAEIVESKEWVWVQAPAEASATTG
jgi:hypothetical protein